MRFRLIRPQFVNYLTTGHGIQSYQSADAIVDGFEVQNSI
jgi:hypothetical protein